MGSATWLLMADLRPQPRVLTKPCLSEDLHPSCRAEGRQNKGNEFSGFFKAHGATILNTSEWLKGQEMQKSDNLLPRKIHSSTEAAGIYSHLCTGPGLSPLATLVIFIKSREDILIILNLKCF